jgi:hypothetical protein
MGCYFHFSQEIYRNIQHVGLSSEYGDNEEVRIICRKLVALPIIPVSAVLQPFDDLHDSFLQSSVIKVNLLKPLFDYYESQWIKTVYIHRWDVYG